MKIRIVDVWHVYCMTCGSGDHAYRQSAQSEEEAEFVARSHIEGGNLEHQLSITKTKFVERRHVE